MPRRLQPSQFYTGLVAELYEALAGEHARADQYRPFLDRWGTPALELACGTGRPLLDLVALGYDVEGLDASADMLARLRAAAAARRLDVNVHQARMQAFSLPRRYRSIFLAGASFTLLTTDADALAALRCMREHLLPGGAVLVPLERLDVDALTAEVNVFREASGPAGERLRCAVTALEVSADGRDVRRRLRYERHRPAAEPEVLEREWRTRAWSQEQFAAMLAQSGFHRVRLRGIGGGAAEPGARVFVALAERGEE